MEGTDLKGLCHASLNCRIAVEVLLGSEFETYVEGCAAPYI